MYMYDTLIISISQDAMILNWYLHVCTYDISDVSNICIGPTIDNAALWLGAKKWREIY